MNVKDFLGVELPIIQAPMAGVQDSALTLAVCEAGGLGSLPCAMLSAVQLQTELATIKSHTTLPFNLNFFCHTPPVPDAKRESQWRKALQPFFEEYDIDADKLPPAATRAAFGHETIDLIESHRPDILSFHFGLPSPELLARVKGWGATVLSSATTVEESLWLQANGADGVIAQGLEAGGHRGMFLSDDLTQQLGTFALLPQIVKVLDVPVIAAGGIADSAGLKAALALGASAVQMGTVYLLCDETKTSAVHRSALKSEHASHTALTNIYSGRPARGIVNRSIRVLGPISSTAPEFPLAAAAISAIRKEAEAAGSGDFTPLWCGQNASGCEEVSAAVLTRQLARQVS
ncbi:MAG: nitronate monooxygenase [Halioglobus sp.]|jgi:nitronate monooxygenase